MVKNNKELIQLLATKYNLPLQKVEEIVYYQFKFVNKIIRKGEFDTVRLPYFGKFHVLKERLEYLNNKKDE
jgi:nucleoid DNA-binding protein